MDNKSGTLFIIAAPSGAGKTSLVTALIEQTENLLVSISHTTRRPRPGEVNGQAYHFVSEDKFQELLQQNRFLEYARVFNNYYGTSREWVERTLAQGKNIILEIDWQGARQVSSVLRNSVSIFILPPDYNSLRERLIRRQNDAAVTIEFRMNAACEEISHYNEFDYIVINDDFDRTLAELKAVITATNLGKCRQAAYYDTFVERIMAQTD